MEATGEQAADKLQAWSVWFLWFLWSIRSVSCVYLNEANQTHRTDQMNKISWRSHPYRSFSQGNALFE